MLMKRTQELPESKYISSDELLFHRIWLTSVYIVHTYYYDLAFTAVIRIIFN